MEQISLFKKQYAIQKSTFSKAFVLDVDKKPLMPCHPARARKLLKAGSAAVFKRYPFTIILKRSPSNHTKQPIDLKFDPGSKVTGMALVGQFKRGQEVLFGSELSHRGHVIKKALDTRRAIRRTRRNRKLRYREPRFNNRTGRKDGWLPPSLMSRVLNCQSWANKLQKLVPITAIAVETVRFDMQKEMNGDINGVEYQQGELQGYEVRQYLLQKWEHKCAYCDAKEVPLQIEHIVPKSKGGSNRVSNLTIACGPCNRKKGSILIKDFLKKKQGLLDKIKRQLKAPLKDAAAVNATRYAIGNVLKTLDLPVTFWSGGRTKWNRSQQGYPKEHWIDAACVGDKGDCVHIPKHPQILVISAKGHGNRHLVNIDKFGFPRKKKNGETIAPNSVKRINGFQTGDMVNVTVTKGKYVGIFKNTRIVSIAKTGSLKFNHPSGKPVGTSWKNFKAVQKSDGYTYQYP
jgi:5-methylcytosine-specific restriction endonuclease McrA